MNVFTIHTRNYTLNYTVFILHFQTLELIAYLLCIKSSFRVYGFNDFLTEFLVSPVPKKIVSSYNVQGSSIKFSKLNNYFRIYRLLD